MAAEWNKNIAQMCEIQSSAGIGLVWFGLVRLQRIQDGRSTHCTHQRKYTYKEHTAADG